MAGMRWADNTRILAIFAVVLLHVAASVVNGVDDLHSYQWWVGNVYDSLSRWCVPVFVMLSGALLLSDDKNESLSVFYKKRALRLLIPLLFWTAFYSGWTFTKGLMRGDAPSLMDLVRNILIGKPYFHMWFLYMIVGLYFFTPYLRILVRNTKKRDLLLLTISMFFIAAVEDIYGARHAKAYPPFIGFFLGFIPYFIAGILIRKSTWRPNMLLLAGIFVFSVYFTAMGNFLFPRAYEMWKGFYFYDYLSVTVIPMSISVMFMLKKATVPIVSKQFTETMAGLTLGIYLVHPMILELFAHFHIVATTFNPLFFIPLMTLFVFGISAVIALAIRSVPYLRRTV